ncbi:isochorismatase family protein [Alcanivorax sp. JB21]|uniref:isochorismatase family protein n=1 Tax=Alcanivorax limicola TaxID=2874102 RepID=UPI001CBB667C|nr:isochorismatase family protein [Alcanivorax limicola]MBZ2188009.1 isochorismatase family protein [Alcanivorax limicola]
MLANAETSTLILIDYQGRLMPAIANTAEVLTRAVRLGKAAQLLGVPVIGTEQRPEKIGHNVAEIAGLCDQTLLKTTFGTAAREIETVLAQGRHELVLAGCETHVCLLQTAMNLLEAGYRVRVVADACGSRFAADRELALARLRQAGADIVTTEMVLFEWLHDSLHPQFKAVQGLLK